eukprot:gene11976-13572_t
MSESDLRLPAPLDVSICLELHSEITRFKSAANIFAVIIMQHCEINELVELFCIGTGPISMTGSKYGIFPAALYPLFSDGRLREKADRLLAATDRRRICLFSSCRYGHPRADEMAICISCDHGHLMCAQCVSVGLSEPSHACEIHNDPTNAVMIDHIYGCSRLVTLARLGCRTAIETTLDDDEMFDALDDASREMLQGCEVGATSPYVRSLVDARVLAAVDSRIYQGDAAKGVSVAVPSDTRSSWCPSYATLDVVSHLK